MARNSLIDSMTDLARRVRRLERAPDFAPISLGVRAYNSVGEGTITSAEAISMRPDRIVCVKRLTSTSYLGYRHLGGINWQEIKLTTGGISGGPYSWNQTIIRSVMSYVRSDDAACTYSGSWTQAYSGDPDKYVGGRIDLGYAVASYVSVDFTGSGDIYVIYGSRDRGPYVKCELDGDTDLCDALPSNGTYRYIDTYDPSSTIIPKLFIKVASNVSAGAHTLKMTVMSDVNPGNTTGFTYFYFNAVALSGNDFGLPYQANTRPPPWEALTVYAQYDQVQVEGRNYYASAGGTSSSTAPTHTSGSASDGTVTWAYMQKSSYALDSQYLQAAGSQMEYAYQVKPFGASTFEDVGGIVHGNETLDSITWYVDGAQVAAPAVNEWIIGETIAAVQDISCTHSGTGSTVVNATKLTHTIRNDRVSIAHSHTWQVNATIGYFYSGMWPLLTYDALQFQYGIDRAYLPTYGHIDFSDYYGTTGEFLGAEKDYIIVGTGDVLMPAGATGVASSELGPLTAILAMRTEPTSVDFYNDAGTYRASVLANVSGTTPPGYSSVVMKMYFERVSGDALITVLSGDEWAIINNYYLFLAPGSTVQFPPK